ncbi:MULTISPECIES: electron transfer flavoprotein-ubiquinone oxidoreductase [Cobetia]|uniref:electron transfer flavoprotein-ubiquinone oxidoreductase n=1 Tax=Cobetia TaxID=204286 RepID=UPI0009865764|nr:MULTISPECIES: electron transfer flavoprotein-ubiquinone oxidoreductase [Cobetia]POR08915.1 electron transfer flavoprotein-ubiquinone oxidoreductase [Cobetia sp. MM1IDA2H-1]
MSQRESIEYDVLIVGGGPAGLSSAIRLKQLDPQLSVVVLEKGSEIGAHVLSGAILDPSGLDALLPDWRKMASPIKTEVTSDTFMHLGERSQRTLPSVLMPGMLHNEGNYIVSMGNVCRWLAEIAESMEVDIFPGMACSELLWQGERVSGVVAGEFGLASDGTPGPTYEPGMEVHAKYVFLAEGARGSLSKQVIAHFELSKESQPQKFGLGLKEIWDIDPTRHKEGTVTHTMGWPLDRKTGGGSFIYHAENHQVFIGFVVHLDYANPYLSPYNEFQRFKQHPMVANLLEGGKRVAYGARAISEGGYQSIPKVTFPGGVLLGCSAGLVNVPRIKGNHNAIHSGIAAAESAHAAIKAGRAGDELLDYETTLREGPVGKDLKPVQNVKPLWSRFGLIGGLALGGLDMWWASLVGKPLMGSLTHRKNDAQATGKAANFTPIQYPKPDNTLSFDRLTNVAFSATNHVESQPSHLVLRDATIPIAVNQPQFAEPSQRYCPAGVYEVVEQSEGKLAYQINFQNCLHCKTCDIKDPSQNITWNTPQGGDGPNYPNM